MQVNIICKVDKADTVSVFKMYGINVEGFNYTSDSDSIRHATKGHSGEYKKLQKNEISVEKSDFDNIKI